MSNRMPPRTKPENRIVWSHEGSSGIAPDGSTYQIQSETIRGEPRVHYVMGNKSCGYVFGCCASAGARSVKAAQACAQRHYNDKVLALLMRGRSSECEEISDEA